MSLILGFKILALISMGQENVVFIVWSTQETPTLWNTACDTDQS